jgi:N-acetyl sugar amidotransferase
VVKHQISGRSENFLGQICSRCIYDESVDGISFDHAGVCNYCRLIEDLIAEYGTGTLEGEEKFRKIVARIKKSGKRKKYDCVVGISGGTDSSYLLVLCKIWGLRPLAVHYDNTWNSAAATLNIAKMLKSLDVDLYTHVVNNSEMDDIFKSFFYAGVAEIEGPTDLAMSEVIYRAAFKYRIKSVLEGHSFMTEGVTPLGRNYFDGRYIKKIHEQFGTQKISTYPLMTLSRFLKWVAIVRIRKIRPLWYLDYSKERAMEVLQRDYGWEYYGGHHLENRMSAFYHTIYAPQKFGTDFRNNTLSALVRAGSLSREAASEIYSRGPNPGPNLKDYFLKRMKMAESEFDRVMSESPKHWTDYPNYKKVFERLAPFFFILAKTELVPMSFYLKYCVRDRGPK